MARTLSEDKIDAFSAGRTYPKVRQLRLQVMGEVGIDISRQRKRVAERPMAACSDYLITVCDR